MTWLIGYGNIAELVARRLLALGQGVHAVSRGTRDPAPGVTLHRVDLDRDDAVPRCAGTVLYTAPPTKQGRVDARLRRWLEAQADCEALVYLSTSGVYGDCGGAWVDEDRQPDPLTDRAMRRLDAERALGEWAKAQAVRLVILRVPGIYGPGRLPLERLARGLPVLEPDIAPWSNRIHADDLASACQLALIRGRGVYNISDGSPGRMTDYFLACARHLGLPRPEFMNWERAEQVLSPQMLSFYRESRRLDIRRARRELGYEPRFPNLELGLQACTAEAPQDSAMDARLLPGTRP